MKEGFFIDIGIIVSGVIYGIFILMSLIYFYLFRKDRTLIHLYLSLIPTFFCIYLLINYHHYQPAEGARRLAILMLISLITFMLYWIIYTIWQHKK